MSRARLARATAAALAAGLAATAAAYVLPTPAILRLAAKKRVELQATSAELRGTFTTGATPPAAAVLWVKGGRCRLELVGLPERPYAIVRAGRVAAQRGLDRVPGALALAEGACALLGPSTPDGYAQSFVARGVALQEVALGRLGPRVAYVLGATKGAPQSSTAAQAWIDKQLLVPIRLLADVGGARRDLQLLDYPPPPQPAPGEKAAPPTPPADLFPRALELRDGDALEARMAVEKVVANPKISDALL